MIDGEVDSKKEYELLNLSKLVRALNWVYKVNSSMHTIFKLRSLYLTYTPDERVMDEEAQYILKNSKRILEDIEGNPRYRELYEAYFTPIKEDAAALSKALWDEQKRVYELRTAFGNKYSVLLEAREVVEAILLTWGISPESGDLF